MNKKFRIIDLFAGAGGFSLGAARAGFEVFSAVELDPRAFDTHKRNFNSTIHIQADLSKLEPKELLALLNLSPGDIDGVIGGPPCQGFSTIGKRNIKDIRNNLFVRFFQFVNILRPSFFVAENVCGLMDPMYEKIRQTAFQQLRGYTLLAPLKVKASDYGAPTSRTRILFIGYDPKRVNPLTDADFLCKKTKCTITVKEALAGLPQNSSSWKKNGLGKIRKKEIQRKSKELQSFYNRVSAKIPSHMADPEILKLYQNKDLVTGCLGTNHSDKIKERYKKLSYGQQDKISKSVKLDPEGLCPTLRAGTGPDKGSFQAVRPIHYSQNRVITPREAARLQGFPDWFSFQPTIWHSFRQIGNSVSPLLAEKILNVIHHKLK